MGLILGIIQSLFNATGMVVTKKVLENKKIGNNLQTLISRLTHSIIIGLLFVFGIFNNNFEYNLFNTYEYSLLIIATIGLYFTYYLRRTAYANEKITVLQPFAMLFQVFPVIFGFIFISTERANLITFLSAILASLVVILSSIDLKKIKINKYSLMVLLSSTIKSMQVFVIIHFLQKFTPASFYLFESGIIITISIILLFFKKQFGEIKLITRKYFKLLVTGNTIAIISIILALTMYSSLGVVLTSLLSLLYLAFIYLLSYLFLKEIPSKKDVIVTLFVAFCIIIGVIFKN